MTDERLSEIQARASAATPGPWLGGTDRPCATLDKMFPDGEVFHPDYANRLGSFRLVCCTDPFSSSSLRGDEEPPEGLRENTRQMVANRVFIAHARADVPELVKEVVRLRAKLRELETP